MTTNSNEQLQNPTQAKPTKLGKSATAIGGGLASTIVCLLVVVIGLLSATPVVTFFAAVGAAAGSLWFAWGVYLFAENVDHIAHNI